MLHLSEEDVKQLNAFIQEMPTKYGLPLLNFLNSKISEQKKKSSETSSELLSTTKEE